MIDQVGKMVLVYPEKTPIIDPATGKMVAGDQLVVILKAKGDEKEYTHQLPITPDLPGEAELAQWMKDGKVVVVSASSVRANSFQHVDKDEEGNPKKYPQPGKMYKAGGKSIEIGTLLSFQSYAIRLATAEEEQRAEQANGRYNERQQQSRLRSVQNRQQKAEARTQKSIAERNK